VGLEPEGLAKGRVVEGEHGQQQLAAVELGRGLELGVEVAPGGDDIARSLEAGALGVEHGAIGGAQRGRR
jgi:hypothetical protein